MLICFVWCVCDDVVYDWCVFVLYWVGMFWSDVVDVLEWFVYILVGYCMLVLCVLVMFMWYVFVWFVCKLVMFG